MSSSWDRRLPSGRRAPFPLTMPPGHVRGYDAFTGANSGGPSTRFRSPASTGNETWEDGSWEYTGNAAVWTALSADPELGYVYLPVELGTGDYYGGHRPGDNLFSQSIVALDASTGERVWHYPDRPPRHLGLRPPGGAGPGRPAWLMVAKSRQSR